jgi:Rrf2 family nitric oxide-sensitive transcriptional repressor
MYLNITTDYAIRILLCLAAEGRPLGAAELSAKSKIPKTYLTAIMAKLKRSGLVSANRGQIGGYCLIKPPKDIRLWDIIAIMERSPQVFRCIQGEYACAYRGGCRCPIQSVYHAAQESVERTFRSVTLQDLVSTAS